MARYEEKKDWEKGNSRYVREQRIKEMSKDDAVKYMDKERRLAGDIALLLYIGLIVCLAIGVGYNAYQEHQLIEKYTARTYALGYELCESIGEEGVAVFSQGTNIVVECNDTNIFLEVNKND